MNHKILKWFSALLLLAPWIVNAAGIRLLPSIMAKPGDMLVTLGGGLSYAASSAGNPAMSQLTAQYCQLYSAGVNNFCSGAQLSSNALVAYDEAVLDLNFAAYGHNSYDAGTIDLVGVSGGVNFGGGDHHTTGTFLQSDSVATQNDILIPIDLKPSPSLLMVLPHLWVDLSGEVMTSSGKKNALIVYLTQTLGEISDGLQSYDLTTNSRYNGSLQMPFRVNLYSNLGFLVVPEGTLNYTKQKFAISLSGVSYDAFHFDHTNYEGVLHIGLDGFSRATDRVVTRAFGLFGIGYRGLYTKSEIATFFFKETVDNATTALTGNISAPIPRTFLQNAWYSNMVSAVSGGFSMSYKYQEGLNIELFGQGSYRVALSNNRESPPAFAYLKDAETGEVINVSGNLEKVSNTMQDITNTDLSVVIGVNVTYRVS